MAERTVIAAERALSGGPLDVPSKAELEGLLPGILDAAVPARPSLASRLLARRGALLGAAGALAAAALVVVVTRPPRHAGDDGFHARGSPAAAQHATVFCVAGEKPRALADGGACPAGASLVVTLAPSLRSKTSSARLTLEQGGDVVAGAESGVDGEGVVGASVALPSTMAPGEAVLVVSAVDGAGGAHTLDRIRLEVVRP